MVTDKKEGSNCRFLTLHLGTDMITISGRIPIFIHPSFWFIAALIGFINSFTVFGTLMWMVIIVISVLIHEMGHALTALFFGLHPRIELVALGGLTMHEGGSLSSWRQFLVVLNGPLFGFALFLLASLLLTIPSFTSPFGRSIVSSFRMVNFFWTVLNLLPILPLDGGQLLRVVCEAIFGPKGLRYSFLTSAILAFTVGVAGFFIGAFFLGVIFFLFAFNGLDAFRKTKHYAVPDQNEGLKSYLLQAEELIEQGRADDARLFLEEIRRKTSEGMIYSAATQYLAQIKAEQGLTRDAYILLKPLRDELPMPLLLLLQKCAFIEKDYVLVSDLAATCYQIAPSPEIALRNAFSYASLEDAHSAIGWLQAAFQEGVDNLSEILRETVFDPIRSDPHFQDFSKKFS